MNRAHSLPPVGSVVLAVSVRLVRPIRYGTRVIVAQADFIAGVNGGRHTLIGNIPIDEISPYVDLDPATLHRSWQVKAQVCDALLRDSDRRFVVLAHDEAQTPILSLKQLTVAEATVTHRQHEPAYEAHGFCHLHNLHRHLLKHVLAPGRDADWLGITPVECAAALGRLRAIGCPDALRIDPVTGDLAAESLCGPCPIAHKLRCFEALAPLRRAYERAAVACMRAASDRRNPRHYHYSDRRRSVLVFMDDGCRKVVAKRRRETYFTAATFFRASDCDPLAPNDPLKFMSERRRIRALAPAASGLKICTPLFFGYR